MDSFNELAQWSVLLLLVVFVFGLTRQLGLFLAKPEEKRGEYWGPDTGTKLPAALFGDENEARMQAVLAGSGTDVLALVLLSEWCESCDTWLQRMDEVRELPLPTLMLADKAEPEFFERMARAGDGAFIPPDPTILRELKLSATPFLMVVDSTRRILYKQVAGDPIEGMQRWSNGNGAAWRSSDNGDGARAEQVVVTDTKRS